MVWRIESVASSSTKSTELREIVKASPGNSRPIDSYQDFIEEVVQSRFERVPGVALSQVYGGRETEIRITFDPYRAAA